MLGLGNTAANQIWEHSLNGKTKPTPTSSYEEKERFIRAKYEAKEFLAPLKDGDTPLEQQIIETITQMNIKQLAHVLAHMSRQNLSFGNSNREKTKTPLHLAASKGCLEICQLLLWVSGLDNWCLLITPDCSTMPTRRQWTWRAKLHSIMHESLAIKRLKNC